MEIKDQRQAYGKALVELGRENRNVVALEADLGKSTMSCFFQEEFPERYFEMGIAEQNMLSTAAGLSLMGKIPFVHSFAVFASGRAFDQIRQTIAIGKLNVKICGSSAGMSDFGDGATHQSVEDMAIMRAIPNMTVLCPIDAVETAKMVKAMAEHEGPVYIRLNRNAYDNVTKEEDPFEIGVPGLLKDGKDVVVFATGIMAVKALEAAKELEGKVSVKVVNVSTIKPLNEAMIVDLAKGIKAVVTAEE
ncbi:MAG TPA: transketolase C-terminal domain-containing protein, partial [Defluviitaleaceae bacterium]|nr:transketolase C-terminal domain-containing protein [Defluviitaleaceae bacterium]